MLSKIIVEAIEQKKYKDDIKKTCCICGIKKAFKYEIRKKILSTSFTDYNYMKYRISNYICGYCEKLLSNKYLDSPTGKKCGLRLYSYIIQNNNFSIIDMKNKIKYLFDVKYQNNFLLCFSKSGKKHIFYKAKLSYDNNTFFVCTEDYNIIFDRKKYKKIFEISNELFQKGITKNELLACVIDPKKIYTYKIDYDKIIQLKKHKHDRCYELIIDCLYKNK